MDRKEGSSWPTRDAYEAAARGRLAKRFARITCFVLLAACASASAQSPPARVYSSPRLGHFFPDVSMFLEQAVDVIESRAEALEGVDDEESEDLDRIAKALRRKVKNREVRAYVVDGDGAVHGHAATFPNSCRVGPTLDPYPYDPDDPDNPIGINGQELETGPPPEYSPHPFPGPLPGPGSVLTEKAQQVMLASVLLHEFIHCGQASAGGAGLGQADLERGAYQAQLDLLCAILDDQVNPCPPDTWLELLRWKLLVSDEMVDAVGQLGGRA